MGQGCTQKPAVKIERGGMYVIRDARQKSITMAKDQTMKNTYVLAVLKCTGDSAPESLARDAADVAVASVPTRDGGWSSSDMNAGTGGGGCPALTRSMAVIISSNSKSVALNGI